MNADATEALRQRLQALSSACIADALGGAGALGHGLRRLTGSGVVAGPAVTAICRAGSGVPMVAASEQAQAGDVLCVAAEGDCAYIGDLLGAHLQHRGIAAVVFDGYVRDIATLAQGRVSYFAKGTHPVALRKREPGKSMTPIQLGATTVRPGDWVIADDDGAVAIAREALEDVLAKAEVANAREERVRALIVGGMDIRRAFEQVERNP